MKVAISRIKVMKRIRKEITKIDELAGDIKQNGLLNPVTVMKISDSDGELQLLAGLRRLKAVQLLKWPEVDVNIVSPADAEARLKIECSENEQREAFTFSEKMDYARMFQEIEQAKAKERMSLGGKGGIQQQDKRHLYSDKKQSRDAIGKKIGMSGRQYDRARYIADNAPEEILEELDNGKRNVSCTYNELRAKERAGKPKTTNGFTGSYLITQDKEAMRNIQEFASISLVEKVAELQQRLKKERARTARAESELSRLKDVLYNSNIQATVNIKKLKMQVKSLDTALEEALARVKELEGKYES
jgi:ParB family chromosome partitioning protein